MNDDEIRAAAERLKESAEAWIDCQDPDDCDTEDMEWWKLQLSVARAYLNPWRPIETAPRDGTRVLAYGAWDQVSHLKAIVFAHFADRWWQNGLPFNPTHWMPLPSPPPVPAA